MKFNATAALLASAFALVGPAFTASMHPLTGEELAEVQGFTYRIGDEHTLV